MYFIWFMCVCLCAQLPGVCVVIMTNGVVSLFSLLGDITQKGYEKKKAKLLASYISHLPSKKPSLIYLISLPSLASLFPV